MVDDPTVGLLRHPVVEAAVSSLHVKDRDLAALGRDDRQAGVGVTEYQKRVRLHLIDHTVHGDDDPADCLGGIRPGGLEEVVGLPQLEIAEEDLIELVVVVLARVDEHMVHVTVQRHERARQADDLGPGAHHRHDLQPLHGHTGSAMVSGRARSKTSLAQSITIISSSPMLVMSWVQPGMVSTILASPPSVVIS